MRGRIHQTCPTIEECLFIGNHTVVDAGAIEAMHGANPTIRNCTFYESGADRYGGNLAFSYGAAPQIGNCIIASATSGGGVFCSDAYPTFECNDAWGNQPADYVGCSDPTGTAGNMRQDPLFCDPSSLDFHLQDESPCGPDENPECGLIGADDVGCGGPTPIRQVTWGVLRPAPSVTHREVQHPASSMRLHRRAWRGVQILDTGEPLQQALSRGSGG